MAWGANFGLWGSMRALEVNFGLWVLIWSQFWAFGAIFGANILTLGKAQNWLPKPKIGFRSPKLAPRAQNWFQSLKLASPKFAPIDPQAQKFAPQAKFGCGAQSWLPEPKIGSKAAQVLWANFGLWEAISALGANFPLRKRFGSQFWALGATFWLCKLILGFRSHFWALGAQVESIFVFGSHWKPIWGFGSQFWALGGDLGFGPGLPLWINLLKCCLSAV